MTILTLDSIHKAYGDRVILDAVSWTLTATDRIGLVGVNGAGKTSLLRILAGTEEPDAGSVVRRRDLVVGYLPQEPHLDDAKTVQETLDDALSLRAGILERIEAVDARLAQRNAEADSALERALAERAALEEALERAGGWEVSHRVERISEALGLPPPESSVSVLSGGERRRLALARVLLQGPDLLLLDEPTNHLDTETIAWLEGTLAAWTGALVLVTHDRYFLERLVNQISEVDRGEIVHYPGAYHDYLEQRAVRLELEARTEAARASLLRRELEWMRRGPKARRHKQKARQQRYEALVEEGTSEARRSLSLRLPDGQRPGKRILELHDVCKGYGDRSLLRDLDLRVKIGDRIGIVGPNGAGKTTLLRLLLGQEQPDTGEIYVGARTQLVYASQTRHELDPNATVYEAVAENTDHVTIDGVAMHMRGYLTRFLFPPRLQETKVGRLSGGERNRLQMARLLRDGGNVILLDEPTNDLDLLTLRALEEALVAFRGVVFVVSHDRYLLNRVATAILAFEDDGQVTLYEGDYDFYAQRRKERLAAEQAAEAERVAAQRVAAEQVRKERRREQAPRKLSFKERRELESMEERILEAEAELEDLNGQLEAPALYKERSAEVPALVERQKATEARVAALYERWSELESIEAGSDA